MNYLIDTDIVANWLRGRTPAVTLLSDLSRDGIAISLVTYAEIYEGICVGHDPRHTTQVFHEFLRAVEVLPLNRMIMRRFARVRGTLRQQGMLLRDPDLMIAATAIYYDLTLVTGNIRHFERIPDLKRHA